MDDYGNEGSECSRYSSFDVYENRQGPTQLNWKMSLVSHIFFLINSLLTVFHPNMNSSVLFERGANCKVATKPTQEEGI